MVSIGSSKGINRKPSYYDFSGNPTIRPGDHCNLRPRITSQGSTFLANHDAREGLTHSLRVQISGACTDWTSNFCTNRDFAINAIFTIPAMVGFRSPPSAWIPVKGIPRAQSSCVYHRGHRYFNDCQRGKGTHLQMSSPCGTSRQRLPNHPRVTGHLEVIHMPAKAFTGKIGDWHELECLSESAICIRAMCDEASDELADNEKPIAPNRRKNTGMDAATMFSPRVGLPIA